MAEPPHPWTTLLAARDWDGFAAAMTTAGCARVGSAELAAAARAEHARLAAQRHPPGPTVELLTIQRLVAAGALSHAALKDLVVRASAGAPAARARPVLAAVVRTGAARAGAAAAFAAAASVAELLQLDHRAEAAPVALHSFVQKRSMQGARETDVSELIVATKSCPFH